MQKLLTMGRAAAHVGLSKDQLRYLIKMNRGPQCYTLGSSWRRFTVEDLDEWKNGWKQQLRTHIRDVLENLTKEQE